VSHLLVTNDFPPKQGGIQSYLWELWRRLPPGEATVLTARWPDSGSFDAAQPFRIDRCQERVLLPTPSLARRIRALAAEVGASLVILDPALPLGLLGPHLGYPYAVVVHGAEVTVPGRLPGTRTLLGSVLRGAVGVIAAGAYPANEAAHAAGGEQRLPPMVVVPPGVDTDRFRVLTDIERGRIRSGFGLPERGPLVVSVSRLVPRKGMDTLVDAVARLARTRPDLTLAIAGGGRQQGRLASQVATRGAPVRLLGRLPDEQLPGLYGAADVFAMLCRDRWGGLEQEGFGIVFLEAAACGVAQVAGDSGGAADAVLDGRTGIVVHRPADVGAAVSALGRLLDDPGLRCAQGRAARARAEADFTYDVLVKRLHTALAGFQP
jgi:phosphatidylinositol alpha-1,6-mannosyltransferase